MNSYQVKQTVRARRNYRNAAKKVQRPPLNFKSSKDKALDKRKVVQTIRIKMVMIVVMMLVITMLSVIMLGVMMMISSMMILVIRKCQTDHPSNTEVMIVTMKIIPLNLN